MTLFEIKEEEKKGNWARFIISPLDQGFGNTLGISLRRVLLGSLSGAAITKVSVAGVKHQFSTLKGMKEDVLDFLLNLKRARFSYQGEKPVKLTLSAKTAGEVKVSDIKLPATVKAANGDMVLANLAKGGKLEAEMELSSGVGYEAAEDRPTETIGEISLDAVFSPVLRVSYKVEETRVGRLTNYDKLTMEITTDGTITPKEALLEGSKILTSYLTQIISPKKVEKKEEVVLGSTMGAVGKLSVEEIGLPTRVANSLYKGGFDTVEKLVAATKEDLAKIRNLGEKSLKIIKVALAEKGVEFNA